MKHDLDDMLIGIGPQSEYEVPAEALTFLRIPSEFPAIPLSLEVTGDPKPLGRKSAQSTDLHEVTVTVPYGPGITAWSGAVAQQDEKNQAPWATVSVHYGCPTAAMPGRRWHSAKLISRVVEVGLGVPALLHLTFVTQFSDTEKTECEAMISPEQYLVEELLAREHRAEGQHWNKSLVFLRLGQTFALRNPRGRKPLYNLGESLWAAELVTSETQWELMEHTATGEPIGFDFDFRFRGDNSGVIRLPEAKMIRCRAHTENEDMGPQMIADMIGQKPDADTPAGVWE